MKTQRVRPVLVESKEHIVIGSIMKYIKFDKTVGSLVLNENTSITKSNDYWQHQELILISLEDEKIVIARQSQISPEYISKFIEQYNNGCVEDLEIEMEYISGWSKLLVEKQGSPIKYHIQPKLTKGFVTIVEKELIHLPIEVKKDSIVIYGAGKFHEERLIINRGQAALLFVELYKFLEFDKSSSKEPITYTEEEVLKYCLEALNMGFDLNNCPYSRLNGKTGTQYFMEWFNQNKKK